jgi:hypothetical protein
MEDFMIRFIALLFVIIAPLAAPPASAPAPETPIALTIPVRFSINFPAISPSSCWRVDQPADGRITAEVTGKGSWSVCIADTACPTDCMSNGRRSASTERLRPGRYYYVKVQTQTPGVTATLSIYPTAGGPPKPSAWAIWTAACGLGVQWDVSESGWSGTWIRRGSSNIFDASWRKGGDVGSSVLTMSLNGNRVHIERRDAPTWGGAYVEYDGTISADGTVSGTGKVPATGASAPFQATIRCL